MNVGWCVASITVGVAWAAEWTPLFNGQDLSGWTRVVQGEPPGEDPEGYFQVRDGVIALYQGVEEDRRVPFGYLRSEETFSRYQMRLEYRWLGKRFAPRKNDLRDAGLLYHVTGRDKVWPACAECQIQEGDTGDLVFLGARALTHLHPQPRQAPAGKGVPGMLPEEGGVPLDAGPGGYIGRYPVADREEGWNQVQITVQGADYAVHEVNGQVRARLAHLRRPDGSALADGSVALQLEAAEMEYRAVEIRELGPPLRPDVGTLALSAVQGVASRPGTITFTHPGGPALPLDVRVIGRDAEAFRVEPTELPKSLAAGEALTLEVTFAPIRKRGRHSAGLVLGGVEVAPLVPLQGLALERFEGRNEPPLQSICHALGCPLDVGGSQLKLDARAATIGDSVDATHFRAAPGSRLQLVPLARFSPPGAQAFGWMDGGEARPLGRLADVSAARPDAHQSLFPPLEGGAEVVEFPAPEGPFALYLDGPHHRCATDPGAAPEAPVPHTARIYPVRFFLGQPSGSAFLVGFEEATNGDYQDALFLLRGEVEAVKPSAE